MNGFKNIYHLQIVRRKSLHFIYNQKRFLIAIIKKLSIVNIVIWRFQNILVPSTFEMLIWVASPGLGIRHRQFVE